MEKGDYKINEIYEPGYGSFHPSKDIPTVNYKIPSGQLGMTTDPRMANQLQAVSTALNAGVIPIEMGVLQPETFDQIPKQHFTEIKRKAKLAESKVSLHAPLVDPAGMGKQGWDEAQRLSAERQLMDVVDKAAMLDDKENIPITIHPANYQGSTYAYEKDKEKGRIKSPETFVVIDRESGNISPIKKETKYYPEGKVEEKIYSPEEQLTQINHTKWSDSLTKIEFEREAAERILQKTDPIFIGLYSDMVNKKLDRKPNQEEMEQIKNVHSAAEHIKEAERSARAAFSKAYQYALEDKDEEQQKILKAISKKYGEAIGVGEKKEDYQKRVNPKIQADAIFELNQNLEKFADPKIYKPVEEFSMEKASDTFANVAMHSYSKYKDKSPILSIENLPAGMAFSQVKDQAKLIDRSRQEFANKLIEKKGVSKSEAKKISEKVIGATFDVGHMNINRKHGFTDDDMAKEAKEIAKYVKHVHLTDNFGYSDSHLPLGMGNVPVKEIMENLGKEGGKARKINEVGGWFEHFKTNPFSQILEASGSPIYSSGEGPYWSQRTGFQQGYMEGYGMMLPQSHYEQFGAGFSRLPSSLGGSTQQGGGAGGRMGGGRE